MKRYRSMVMMVLTTVLLGSACAGRFGTEPPPPPGLKDWVRPIKQSVVTVVNYDLEGDVSSIGSGFFISTSGVLLTNFHVLDGAYNAEIKTSDGSRYPVAAVMARSQVIDLIKVRVDIPADRVTPIVLATQDPEVADSVFVVGSPMGLEQTVSEGIISAIRELPGGANILQLTAPISRGSSGGPVLNQRGEAVGVVTFQAANGQNLNFAISINALEMLFEETREPSLAEWTIHNSRQGPALAAALCGRGSGLTIRGEYAEALTFFKQAAEANPDDPNAWYGLGSCYVGLDQQDNAIAAYKHPIEKDPDNAVAHFILAMYYKAIGQHVAVIAPLMEVIRIDPANVRARFELGRAYGAVERTAEQIDAFEAILVDQPDHLPTLLNLGTTLGSVGRLEEAMDLFTRANALEPENELIYYNMGVTYNRMDRPEAALRAYTQAIRVNPRMAAAHYNLALTHLKQGSRKRALDEYDILKDLDADAARALFDRIYPDE
ncbi:tetratricopeptide repeat protein [Desulfosarcina sp.]|uniref:tetratricopeptide repeat protein n=1 Tax=Desulfosarcina sp. TaxID=2027861 RepID=UPI00397049ED